MQMMRESVDYGWEDEAVQWMESLVGIGVLRFVQ